MCYSSNEQALTNLLKQKPAPVLPWLFKTDHQTGQGPCSAAPEGAVFLLPAALYSSWCHPRLQLRSQFKSSAPHPAVLWEGAIAAQLAPGIVRAAPWESSLGHSPVNRREKKRGETGSLSYTESNKCQAGLGMRWINPQSPAWQQFPLGSCLKRLGLGYTVRTFNKCINKDLVLIKSKQAISKRNKGTVSSVNGTNWFKYHTLS